MNRVGEKTKDGGSWATYDRTNTTINTPVPFLLDDSLYTMDETVVSRLSKLGIFDHLCPVIPYLSVSFFSQSPFTQSTRYDIFPHKEEKGKKWEEY